MVSTQADSSSAAGTGAPEQETEPMTVGLWLIVIFKALTALLLWGAFVLLLFAQQQDPRNFFTNLIFRTFRGDPPAIAIHAIVSNTEFITKTMIIRVAIATVAYAMVESTEAIGLMLRKAWAKWLVILVTVSFIPVEIFEITQRPNPIKILTLVANILVLWYLVKRLVDKRSRHAAKRAGQSALAHGA